MGSTGPTGPTGFNGSIGATGPTGPTGFTGSGGALLTALDDRIIEPSAQANGRMGFGFTSFNNNNTNPYADFLHMRSYTDASGGADNLLMLRKDAIGMRIWQAPFGNTSAYSVYNDVVVANSAGHSTVSGSFRAPIFYDSNNTAYYLDAANATISMVVAGNVGIGAAPDSTVELDVVQSSSFAARFLATGADSVVRIHRSSGAIVDLNARASSFGIEIADTEMLTILSNGNVGIGNTSPGYKLEVNGSFAATTKSFVIDHPTKPDMKLRYGSLEGPENGVYARGRLKSNKIKLPEYWTGLVDEATITVNLTPIGRHQNLWVEDIIDNAVIVGGDAVNCFYTVFAERKDVEKLEVEF